MFDINFIEKSNQTLSVGDYIWVSSTSFENSNDYDDLYLPVLYIDDLGLIDSLRNDVTFQYSGDDLECVKLSMDYDMLHFFICGGHYSDESDNNSLELFERNCKPGDLVLMSYSEFEMDCIEYGIYVGHNEIYNGSVILKYSLGHYLKLDNLSLEQLKIREQLYLNYQKYINISNLKNPSIVRTGDTYFLDDIDGCELHICIGRKDDKLLFLNLHSDESFIMDFISLLMNNKLHTIDLLDYMSYLDYTKLFTKRKYGYNKSKYKYLGKYNYIKDSLSFYDVFLFSKSVYKLRNKICDANKECKDLEKLRLTDERKEKLRLLNSSIKKEFGQLQISLQESNDENESELIREKMSDLVKLKTESEYELYNYYGNLYDEIDKKYKEELDMNLSNFDSYLEKLSLSIKSGKVYNLKDLEKLSYEECLKYI